MSEWDALDRTLITRFATSPRYHVRAPGRINLIGEHTDYNEGFVLPLAIDRAVRIAAAPAPEPLLRFHAAQFGEDAIIPTNEPEARGHPQWARYVQGVAGQLRRAGVRLRGIAAVVDGDLPAGAGLASSAALEVGAALALLAAAGATLERERIAHLARRAEVEFVGVRCGIMDQLAVALGRRGEALLIDCRSLEITPVPVPVHWGLLLCDTGVRRTLEDSSYNARRRECEMAVAAYRRRRPSIRTLRDLGPDDLPLIESALPDPLRRRTRHVVTENRRVLETVEAFHREDGAAVGRLLDASHRSLRDDYEVSIPELDAMADAVRAAGALGARLTGAGFGGAVVALVNRHEAESVARIARANYLKAVGKEGVFLFCAPADGAALHEVRGAPAERS